jgi:hypothetical protein
MSRAWYLRNSGQPGLGPRLCRAPIYFATVLAETLNPNLANSVWIRFWPPQSILTMRDAKRPHRERGSLLKERTSTINRMKSILAQYREAIKKMFAATLTPPDKHPPIQGTTRGRREHTRYHPLPIEPTLPAGQIKSFRQQVQVETALEE